AATAVASTNEGSANPTAIASTNEAPVASASTVEASTNEAPAAPVAVVTTREAPATVAVNNEPFAVTVISPNVPPANMAPTDIIIPTKLAPVVRVRTAAVSIKTHSPAAPKMHRHAPVQKPRDELVTVSGTVYNDARVEHVNPGGIVISYTLQGGGLGMTEIDISDLPSAFRQKYHLHLPDSQNQ
ncbi:MAG: hypothetical protein ACREFR_17075, partial [Limisphaerales bacterium]